MTFAPCISSKYNSIHFLFLSIHSYADFFLHFDPPVGDDYTAAFTDDSTLVLTVLSGNSGWVYDTFGTPSTMRINPTGQIRNYAGSSDPADYLLNLQVAFSGCH